MKLSALTLSGTESGESVTDSHYEAAVSAGGILTPSLAMFAKNWLPAATTTLDTLVWRCVKPMVSKRKLTKIV